MRSGPAGPFAMAGTLDVSETSQDQLILFDRTSSWHDLTKALFRVAGVIPRGITERDNIEAPKRMVEPGLGVALLPGKGIADAPTTGSQRRVDYARRVIRRQILSRSGSWHPTNIALLSEENHSGQPGHHSYANDDA